MGACFSTSPLPSSARKGCNRSKAEDDGSVQRMPDCVPGCPFCAIAGGHREQEKIVHQTDRLVVFRDRSPAATCHLQIVPRKHIDNLHDLQPSTADHALVLEMLQTGQEVLERLHPGALLRFGFHRPPFNSVLHLHMHGLVLPFLPDAAKWKYQTWTPWWIPAEDVLAGLEPPSPS